MEHKQPAAPTSLNLVLGAPNEDKKRMQKAGLPEDSIGEYMLLNLEEDGWFSANKIRV